MSRSSASCLVSACLSYLLTPPLDAQVSRLGGEFLVNNATVGYQDRALAMHGSGDFVVVWMSDPADGGSYGVLGRRFSSAGAPLANAALVNTFITGVQTIPAIAMNDSGSYVVVWLSFGQDGSSAGVFGRRFDASGVAQATEFQINVSTSSNQTVPAVAMAASGDFVVVWRDDSSSRVMARRFSSSGVAQGGEFTASGVPSNAFETNPAIAMEDNGDFVVAYERLHVADPDPADWAISAQRISSSGTRLGSEIRVTAVSTFTAERQFPRVAMDADGDFVVVWQGDSDSSASGVYGRRYDSSGVAQGTQFKVNSYITNVQNDPDVAMDASGRFIVTWQSYTQDGNFSGIFARPFSTAGAAQATEFQVNTHTLLAQNGAAVAMDDHGRFVVAWQSYLLDGSYTGVFAQRFAMARPLDIDGDGQVLPLTDGLLLLRFLFGFTGTTLTSGVVGASCSRCDSTAIAAYLTASQAAFDIDGDGELVALTDGPLAVRFAFGFAGAQLIAGAVDLDCTRCDATSIASYLATLT